MSTVIIGNGIIALTTAFRLIQKTKGKEEITIIGKFSRPRSATRAAAAMLNSFCEIEAGSLNSDIDLFHFELSHLATRMWPQFVLDHLEAGKDCLPEGCDECQGSKGACFELGTYLINNTASDSLEDENYEAVLSALRDFNESHSEVNPRDIPNYSPHQGSRANRAVFIPNEGWLNPKLTIDSLQDSLDQYDNVHFVDGEVDKLVRKSDKLDYVLMENGEKISGDKYLLATGATASDLISKSKLGFEIPRIFYGVGVSVLLNTSGHTHSHCIRTPNRGLACGLYSVPFYTSPKKKLDQVLIGSSNYISPEPRFHPRVGSVQNLVTGAMEQINKNFYKAEIDCINVGCRPEPGDGYPVLGVSELDNLIIATGTKRDGFHLSPLLSEYLASLIKDEKVDPRYESFSPKRKLIKKYTREQAIDLSIKHIMSAQYQHGLNIPHNKLDESLKTMIRNDLEKLHDKVGIEDWGIPPSMIDMYRYGHLTKDD